MCARIEKTPQVDISDLRENYVSPELLKDQLMANPIDQVLHIRNGKIDLNLQLLKTMCSLK